MKDEPTLRDVRGRCGPNLAEVQQRLSSWDPWDPWDRGHPLPNPSNPHIHALFFYWMDGWTPNFSTGPFPPVLIQASQT